MTWNITETLDLVRYRFGADQRELANASIQSANQRLRFAHYHYHTLLDLLQSFMDEQLKNRLVLEMAWSSDEEAQGEYYDFMDKVDANAMACVQAIHAIADLYANGIFYSLDLNRLGKLLRPHQIDLRVTLERLAVQAQYSTVEQCLKALVADASFLHVEALSNQAKHSQIIRTKANEDLTGTRERRLEIRFSSFERKGTSYPEVEVSKVLAPAYAIASRTVVDVGKELTRLLK